MLRNHLVVEAEIEAVSRRLYVAALNDAPVETLERLRKERCDLAQEWGAATVRVYGKAAIQ